MLSASGRRVRLTVALLFLLVLVVGTFFGDDDSFPFGPFRMYSTRNSLDGFVNSPEFVGITTDGEEVPVSFQVLGLRRAEVEGQITRMVEDPDLLGLLAEAKEELDPGAPELVELRLYLRVTDLEDGYPAGETVELLSTWKRDT
ncbi:MAG: hypothetical protein JJE05_13625 [Actinobacteria bacterium]|nr:hypothetical protein [Actinomycetota bacterium]